MQQSVDVRYRGARATPSVRIRRSEIVWLLESGCQDVFSGEIDASLAKEALRISRAKRSGWRVAREKSQARRRGTAKTDLQNPIPCKKSSLKFETAKVQHRVHWKRKRKNHAHRAYE